MKTFIAGLGEVGEALRQILDQQYPVFGYDGKSGAPFAAVEGIEILHICFPYSSRFVEQVKEYQRTLKPKYTVIHSTVPVGTSSSLSAIHSPIRGLHPNLRDGILTFVKFLGGSQAGEVADYFRRAGIKVHLCDKAETTELAKLFDTEYYRVCIEFAQNVKALCDRLGVPYAEVYTIFNQTYNEGYAALRYPEYIRPVLQPIMRPIGGHCVKPNQKLMSELMSALGVIDKKN